MTVLRLRSAIGVACVLSIPVVASGQALATLDVGGARITYGDTLGVTAATATGAIKAASRLASFAASVGYSHVGGANTMQGDANVSLFTPRLGAAYGEVAAAGGGSSHSDATRTGDLRAFVRAHLAAGRGGAWLGAGAGRIWDGDAWLDTRLGEVGLWGRPSPASLISLSFSPIVVADTIKYGDAEGWLQWAGRSVDLDARLGARSGSRIPSLPGDDRIWGSASLAFWVLPRTAIVAGAGSYPVDFVQGYPGGRFVSLSVRLASRRGDVARSQAIAGSGSAPTSAAARLEDETMLEAAGGGRRLLILAPSARTVEVRGDFTGWEPVLLARSAGGWWRLPTPLIAGSYEMAVRIDDGQWRVPKGLMRRTDEFGVVTGLLVVD